jgi:uncharacterized protein YoxC
MMMDIAAGIVALAGVAFIVFLVFLIPMLLELRKTAEESSQLLRRVNEELPALLREATHAAENLNSVSAEIRAGAARARVLGEAMGEVGDTIHRVNGLVAGKAGALLNVGGLVKAGALIKTGTALLSPSTLVTNVRGLAAGFRAALGVLKNHSQSHHQGGSSNGG